MNSGKRRTDKRLAPPAVGACDPCTPPHALSSPSCRSVFLEQREGVVSCPWREVMEELTTQSLSDAERDGSPSVTLELSKQ